MRIIPIQPDTDPTAEQRCEPRHVHSATTSRRTFGRGVPSRRTFGRGFPSRRTFGRGMPSRRTFGWKLS